MAATEPIRNKEQLKDLANYFLLRGQYRNHAMIIMATCTALRISDLLRSAGAMSMTKITLGSSRMLSCKSIITLHTK